MFPRLPSVQNLNPASNSEPSKDGRSRFCQHCGSRIPLDSESCPYCGKSLKSAPLPSTIPKRKGIIGLIGKNMGRVRIITFLTNLLIFVAFLFIGSQTSLSREEASLLIQEFIKAFGPKPTFTRIALNNILLCLLLSIPLFGTLFLAFASYNSGLIVAASALASGSITPVELFFTLFMFPWTWMEMAAYSLASAQSMMLLLGAFTRNLKKEAKNFVISLAISLVIIGLGSAIEAAYMGIST